MQHMHPHMAQTSQKDFGALSIEVPDGQVDDLQLSTDSPHSWTSESEQPASVRLVLQREKPYKIREPSPEWLSLFGFTAGQVTDRAFRICHGPETNVAGLSHLIENVDKNPTPTETTLYTISGDELRLKISGKVESDGSLCTLFMEDESARVPKERTSRVPKLVLSSEAPYNVVRANSKFLEYFQLQEADVFEQGIGAIFCHRTDGTRWRNLLKSALEGGRNHCDIATKRGDITAQTTVNITPVFDKFGQRICTVEVSFKDAPAAPAPVYDWNSGSSTSTESFHSELETKVESQRTAATCGPARTTSAADRSVMSHLKAMKAARKKTRGEESRANHDSTASSASM